MRYAELRNEILKARDARWDTLRLLAEMYPGQSVVSVCANIAGPDKDDERARRLIGWAEGRMASVCDAHTVGAYGDAAGYIVFMRSGMDKAELKRAAVATEEYAGYCRLLDIDIYDGGLSAVSRTQLGIKPRQCLLCGRRAADCMRTGEHDISEIIAETDSLLDKFVDSEQSSL